VLIQPARAFLQGARDDLADVSLVQSLAEQLGVRAGVKQQRNQNLEEVLRAFGRRLSGWMQGGSEERKPPDCGPAIGLDRRGGKVILRCVICDSFRLQR